MQQTVPVAPEELAAWWDREMKRGPRPGGDFFSKLACGMEDVRAYWVNPETAGRKKATKERRERQKTGAAFIRLLRDRINYWQQEHVDSLRRAEELYSRTGIPVFPSTRRKPRGVVVLTRLLTRAERVRRILDRARLPRDRSASAGSLAFDCPALAPHDQADMEHGGVQAIHRSKHEWGEVLGFRHQPGDGH